MDGASRPRVALTGLMILVFVVMLGFLSSGARHSLLHLFGLLQSQAPAPERATSATDFAAIRDRYARWGAAEPHRPSAPQTADSANKGLVDARKDAAGNGGRAGSNGGPAGPAIAGAASTSPVATDATLASAASTGAGAANSTGADVEAWAPAAVEAPRGSSGSADGAAALAVATRRGAFKVMSWATNALVTAVSADGTLDAAAVRLNAQRIAVVSQIIPDLFGVETRGFPADTRVLDSVWTDLERFDAGFKALTAAMNNVSAAARTGDKLETRKATAAAARICAECHTAYVRKVAAVAGTGVPVAAATP